MKKTIIYLLLFVLCICLTACASNTNSGKGISSNSNASIESKAVDIAIENWINNNFYSSTYKDYDFIISSKEENNSIRATADGKAYQYYNVYGKVDFFDEYGDLKKSSNFTVVYAYDGDTFFVSDERTIIR